MNFIGLLAVVLFCIWFWEKHPGLVILAASLLGGAVVYFIVSGRKAAQEYREMLDRMTPEERAEHEKLRQEQARTGLYGPLNQYLVCPHCATLGQVRSKAAVRSTTAVTNTIAKVSATTDRDVTQRHCDKCQTTWDL